MELHSYAKRRASKKWTIEQKRKLVEARIANDGIFSKKPANCLTTWKKFVSLAKLDDFNVSFVRKQWSNMVAKYKTYRKSRLGNLHTDAIDDELLRKVCQEWEFFYPIHCYMSRKMTNLHSYALTQGQKQKQSASNVLTQQQQQEQDKNNASLASQLEKMLAYNNGSSPETKPGQNLTMFSSDTNDYEYAAAETISSEIIQKDDIKLENDETAEDLLNVQQKKPNTDHDFYSKKSPKQQNYFGSETDDEELALVTKKTQNVLTKSNDKLTEHISNEIDNSVVIKTELDNIATVIINNDETADKVQNNQQQDQQNQNKQIDNEAAAGSKRQNAKSSIDETSKKRRISTEKRSKRNRHLSEQDKYYRHKRRFNRRLEHRFDALLNVFGQIVKFEYPSIDVRPILDDSASAQAHYNRWNDNPVNGRNTDGISSSGESTDAEISSSNEEGAESQAESTMED